jgi:RNA polymerase sigma factor (sigma-70 family)
MDGLSLALERLVRRSEESVRRIGLRHGLGEAEIDELFQDVRIRLWKVQDGEAGKLDEISSSYVYRTATSAALDMIRKKRRAPHRISLEERVPGPESQNPDYALEQDRLARKLEGALARLHDRRRPVVRMHLAGYPREEIAEVMGWTEAKTRNLLYRGLADLRAFLGEPE